MGIEKKYWTPANVEFGYCWGCGENLPIVKHGEQGYCQKCTEKENDLQTKKLLETRERLKGFYSERKIGEDIWIKVSEGKTETDRKNSIEQILKRHFENTISREQLVKENLKQTLSFGSWSILIKKTFLRKQEKNIDAKKIN